MNRLLPFALSCATLALAGTALAQPRPDPLDPGAAVPPVPARSAFTGYRPAADTRAGDWRQANDTVGRIGGWRVYAREAAAPAADPSKPAPAAASHGDHGAPGAAGGHGQQTKHGQHHGQHHGAPAPATPAAR